MQLNWVEYTCTCTSHVHVHVRVRSNYSSKFFSQQLYNTLHVHSAENFRMRKISQSPDTFALQKTLFSPIW